MGTENPNFCSVNANMHSKFYCNDKILVPSFKRTMFMFIQRAKTPPHRVFIVQDAHKVSLQFQGIITKAIVKRLYGHLCFLVAKDGKWY